LQTSQKEAPATSILEMSLESSDFGKATTCYPFGSTEGRKQVTTFKTELLFSLQRAQGGLINVYTYLKAGCRENEGRLFSVVPSARTRGTGHKLEHGRYHLNTRQHFCVVQVT